MFVCIAVLSLVEYMLWLCPDCHCCLIYFCLTYFFSFQKSLLPVFQQTAGLFTYLISLILTAMQVTAVHIRLYITIAVTDI